MLRRFYKELVVEEPNRSTQQLAGGQPKSRGPGQVMERGFELPGTERVEEHLALILCFVEVKFVKKGVALMGGGNDLVELFPKLFKLERIENPDPGQEPILFEAVYLLPAQSIALPLAWRLRAMEELADWFVLSGKVHGIYFFAVILTPRGFARNLGCAAVFLAIRPTGESGRFAEHTFIYPGALITLPTTAPGKYFCSGLFLPQWSFPGEA